MLISPLQNVPLSVFVLALKKLLNDDNTFVQVAVSEELTTIPESQSPVTKKAIKIVDGVERLC